MSYYYSDTVDDVRILKAFTNLVLLMLNYNDWSKLCTQVEASFTPSVFKLKGHQAIYNAAYLSISVVCHHSPLFTHFYIHITTARPFDCFMLNCVISIKGCSVYCGPQESLRWRNFKITFQDDHFHVFSTGSQVQQYYWSNISVKATLL